jgi:acetyl-CoA acetyltransferase family protein
MAQTAERCAAKYSISREAQDEYALRSQQCAAQAWSIGLFDDEVVPVEVKRRKGGTFVERDDHLRSDATLEGLAALSPAFSKDGTVTAGNASGIVDGGAAVVLASTEAVKARGLTPLARLTAWSVVGVDPSLMGMGPVPAIRMLLERAGLTLADIDLFEINEAFAAQYLAVEKELELDRERVNVNGGAIALGHPLGMTGTRLLLTLTNELRRRGAKRGIAAACIGGGQGIAALVESV